MLASQGYRNANTAESGAGRMIRSAQFPFTAHDDRVPSATDGPWSHSTYEVVAQHV